MLGQCQCMFALGTDTLDDDDDILWALAEQVRSLLSQC